MWLWIAAVALQVASSALALIDVRQVRAGLAAEVAQRFPAEAALVQERVVVAVLALLLGAGLLIALLELGLMVALNRGKRWARMTSAVLAGVVLVHAVIVAGGLRSAFLVGLVVASGIAISAVVVSFRPSARVWFGGGEKA